MPFKFQFRLFTNYTRARANQCHVCEVQFQPQVAPFHLSISNCKRKKWQKKIVVRK